MIGSTRIAIPTLVRIKSHALARVGIYLTRFHRRRVAVLQSAGLSQELPNQLRESLQGSAVDVVRWAEVGQNDFECAVKLFESLPSSTTAIVGMGGGKALDVAKYVAFLGRWPYFAVPTSLSNDGFCSPQSSLTMNGKRRSLPAAMPFGVVVDTTVCAQAPTILSRSGVGDLAAKFTAIFDWKLSFHHTGELVDDFAALLSDGTVHAFMNRSAFDEEGIRLLATSLLLNGIAMEVCGSSRPASGSEHLISHALDEISVRPRLHGLQVGVATYLMSLLQQHQSQAIAKLFDATGFWKEIANDPWDAEEWLQAISRAPSIKEGYFTILSTRNILPEASAAIRNDPWLAPCFRS